MKNNDKKELVLKELFNGQTLYKFGREDHNSFALRLDKEWVNKYGLVDGNKLWVNVVYEGNKVIIKAISNETVENIINTTINETDNITDDNIIADEEQKQNTSGLFNF